MTGSAYDDWIGRAESVEDRIAPAAAAAMAATLNREPTSTAGDGALPHLWHWIYFLDRPRTDELGSDGHVERGRFLPPVDLPRRMWGGSRLAFHRPLRLGEAATRTSRIADVVEKQGRSGALVIVTVEHTISGEDGRAITEEQDVVYRGEPKQQATAGSGKADATSEAPPHEWSRELTANPVLLFRYSALTFNSHRIHFDQPYATQVEGYPGLVVHGPLVATLLMEELAARYPERVAAGAHVRAMRPLFHGTPFRLQGRLADDGRRAELWCLDADGATTMQVTVDLEA